MNGLQLVLTGDSPRYRSIERIDAGGLADVYEAEDTVTKRVVAIKRMRRCFRANTRVEAHWIAEARALRRLDGNLAPRLHDRGVTLDGLAFLVMDLLHGPSFRAWIETAPPLARSLAVFARVLDAVQAIHQLGVVHGDLKTGNVMLSHDTGSVRLIDFGLAELDGDGEGVLAPRGCGTPEYAAPEIAAGDARTTASDVYSAGAMLYELLTGNPPFTGASTVQILERHAGEPIVPPSSRSALPVSRQLDAIAMRALAKTPADRFPSMAAMAASLACSRPTWPEQRPQLRSARWDQIATAPWR